MLRSIFRDSNKVWDAMYYDDLLDTPNYQISYLADAERPYFNCAHVVQDKNCLEAIENYFEKRNLSPAIYIDPEGPQDLERTIKEKGYSEILEEQENWYGLDCSYINISKIRQQIYNYQNSFPEIQCISFLPLTPSSLLDEFMELNGSVNQIPDHSLAKLKKNLLFPKESGVRFVCFLVCTENKAISTGLMGCYNGKAFLAEAATHPEYQNKGIHTWQRKITTLLAAQHRISHLYVNCDRDSYSNNTYRRLGFKEICQRRLFIKN